MKITLKKTYMRTSYTMAKSLCICLCLIFFFTCSSSKRLSQDSPKNMIVGHWVVESINFGPKVVSANSLGREISFSFLSDGTTTFTGPSGLTEHGRYQVEDSKIYDPANPLELPVEIVSIDDTQLVISMIENGEEMKMTLVPRRESVAIRK